MFDTSDAQRAMGAVAYSSDGDKLGKVGQVFLDDKTGEPDFLTVNTGLFGTNESFVPTHGATMDGDEVKLNYTKDQIKDAPNVDLSGNHLDQSEEDRLFQHYGLDTDTHDTNSETSHDETVANVDSHDTHDTHDTTDASGSMTRSEERLQAGTVTEEAGRARLRKYVTTEEQTVTVPVKTERAVLETEPISAGDHDGESVQIGEEEQEVILSQERVVTDTVAEPVEKVRIGTETTTSEETVTEEVRKEKFDIEGDVDTPK